jgi:hypothetical protein
MFSWLGNEMWEIELIFDKKFWVMNAIFDTIRISLPLHLFSIIQKYINTVKR